MKHDDLAQDKKLIKRAFGMHDKQLHEDKKTDLSKLKKGGITMKKMSSGGPSAAPKYPSKTAPKATEDMDMGMKKGGKVKKMAKGGVTGSAMKAMGRNLARARNQKPGSK